MKIFSCILHTRRKLIKKQNMLIRTISVLSQLTKPKTFIQRSSLLLVKILRRRRLWKLSTLQFQREMNLNIDVLRFHQCSAEVPENQDFQAKNKTDRFPTEQVNTRRKFFTETFIKELNPVRINWASWNSSFWRSLTIGCSRNNIKVVLYVLALEKLMKQGSTWTNNWKV